MSYFARVAQTGFPASVFLGCLGYIFGTLALNRYEHVSSDYPIILGGISFSLSLPWRMAILMSAAGFGLVALYQLIVGPMVKTRKSKHQQPFVDTESMLLELLDQADAAEKVRQSSMRFSR